MEAYKVFFALSLLLLSTSMIGAQDDSDEGGQFSVTVDGSCKVSSTQFSPPGNDVVAVNNTQYTLSALSKNTSSTFYFDLLNHGNMNASATSEIDIRSIDAIGESWDNTTQNESINLSKQENLANESYEPNTSKLIHYVPEGDDTVVGNTILIFFKDFVAEYESGNYISRLHVNYTCPNNETGNYSMYRKFRIFQADGTGSGVEQDDFPSDDPYPALSNLTVEELANYTQALLGGNFTSELERPANANRTGNFTTNTTLPADANRTGEESNQTVEGDNDNPGQTPVPEPEPEPTPGDSPEPGESEQTKVEIDIEPTNNTYTAYQGQYAPAELEVENIGEQTVTDITLIPEIGQVRPDWDTRNATVSNLTVNESVTRDVFVRPPEDQPVGNYLVPVTARNEDSRLDLDYFTVDVKRSEFVPRVSIQEAPRTVSVETGTNQTLPVLVQNPGRRNITNVTARLQNAEDCGDVSASSVSIIDVNGTESMEVSMEAGENPQSCDATLIVSSANGAYAFSDMTIENRPEEGLIPQEQRAPFIAIIWTFVLAAYAVLRKRYELNTSLVKLPFFMLLIGETVIILYMLVSYYGVVSASFLPF